MKLTMGQAAKQLDCSKATLSRAIKDGRLSAERREDGSYAIDPAELQRYADSAEHRLLREPVPQPLETPAVMRSTTPNETPETPNETRVIQVELEALRERFSLLQGERDRERAQLNDQIQDLRRRLDAEGEERRKLTALLTDQRAKADSAASGGFWARLWGKTARTA
jgi:excisionase family DNA binding protein